MAFEIRKTGSDDVTLAYTPDSAMEKARELSRYTADIVINAGTGLEAKPWAFARYGKIYQRAKCSACGGNGKGWSSTSPCASCRGHGVTSGDEVPT